jgi:hypothetical protein
MTDEEVRQQAERTDAFIAAFRELIASTAVNRQGDDIATSARFVRYRTNSTLSSLSPTITLLLLIGGHHQANRREAWRTYICAGHYRRPGRRGCVASPRRNRR